MNKYLLLTGRSAHVHTPAPTPIPWEAGEFSTVHLCARSSPKCYM